MRAFRVRAAVAVAGLSAACFDAAPPGASAADAAAAPQDIARADRVTAVDIQLVDVGNPGDIGEGEAREVIGVEVDPMNAALSVTNGAPATRAFRAIGVRRDGARVPLPTAVWSIDDRRLGDINNDGLFTATGVGGRVEVRVTVTGARAMVLNAAGVLSVVARREVVDPLTPNLPARFSSATQRNDPARAARVLYPLDGALMPNNVAPPVIQWERGARGDAYRVRLSKPHGVSTVYLTHGGDGFPFATLVGDDAWRLAAESDPDAELSVTVDRLDAAANEVIVGNPVRVRFSRGRVYGSVYYWNLLAGRMSRIRPAAARSEDLVPRPAPRASDGARCVACHTVSRDGRYMAAQVTTASPGVGMAGGVFDLTADLSADPAPTVSSSAVFQCASFSPDGARLLTCATGTWSGPLGMIDPRTGMGIVVGGLPSANATMPEWAPDGRHVAYIANVRLDALGNPVGGDLALLRDPGGTPTIFDPPMIVHAGNGLAMGQPAGEVDAYPTWSPDAQLIAFQHGAGAFSITGPGALYLVSRQGGAPWRLDRANGGAAGVDSYRPTFSPFVTDEGGGRRLLWLAYFSRRDYGNAQVGTRGSRRRQIWVTAVEASPRMGSDPSNVGYWLPGQDVATENMAAYWSAEACRPTGNECRTAADCCSGTCRQDPVDPARYVCRAPEPAECRRRGQTCGSSAECCEGLMCYANVCDTPPA